MERKQFIQTWIMMNSKDFMRKTLKAEHPIAVIATTMFGLASKLDNLKEGREKWLIEAKLIVLNELWGTLNEKMGVR